jgi:hypothetical protein
MRQFVGTVRAIRPLSWGARLASNLDDGVVEVR